MKKVNSVFDEPVISDDNTQEICNEHNVTEINYQKGRRMVLVNIKNRASTKSVFKSTIWPLLYTVHIQNSTNMV